FVSLMSASRGRNCSPLLIATVQGTSFILVFLGFLDSWIPSFFPHASGESAYESETVTASGVRSSLFSRPCSRRIACGWEDALRFFLAHSRRVGPVERAPRGPGSPVPSGSGV